MSMQSWVYLALDAFLIGNLVWGLVLAIKVKRTLRKLTHHLAEAQACHEKAGEFLKQAEQRLRAAGIAGMIIAEMNGDHTTETMQ